MLTSQSSRLRLRTSLTALVVAYLSVAILLTTPVVLSTDLSASKTVSNKQEPDAASEISAATTSLQSGQGPLGTAPISCSSRGPGSAYCGAAPSGESALASNTPSWTNITGPGLSRNGGAMSYDAADGYVILFGGTDAANNFLGDTWKFIGGSWTNITTASGPSPRALGSMVYDSADGYLLLFGGGSGTLNVFPTAPLHDTWKFSAGSWENITSSSAPSPRLGAAMVYDGVDGYVILFGGLNTAGSASTFFLHDTWKFSGGSWTNVTLSSSPSPPLLASMAYDAGDGYVVLFGPIFSTGSSTPSSDNTWKFSAGVWTNITSSSGPSTRAGGDMTYDTADGYVVLFGGQGPGLNNFLVDTWKFSAGVWTNITTSSGPSRRAGSVMTYDGADGYVVLFGGLVPGATGFTFLQDSWRFLGGSWTNIAAVPSQKGAASMAYDAKDGYVVLFGGGTTYGLSSETWKFSAGVWSNITTSSGPPPRIFAAMTYDTSDGYIVLFGGQGFGVLLSDTWKFSAGVWTNITSASGPSRRVVSAMSYDTADSYTVLFGGCKLADSSNGSCLSFLGDTWKFQGGLWTNITSVVGPSRRLAMSLTYDAADSYVLLFGGASVGKVLSDTWKFQGGVWTNITTVGGPSRRAGASLAYDSADGYSVLFGGDNFSGLLSNSLLGDSWKFLAGSWTNITSSVGPSARFGGSIAFDAADGYVILFGGQDRAGNFIGQTWKFSASVSTPSPWTNITPSGGPSSRSFASMAYDAADSYVVLFGGESSHTVGDTWKFTGGSWTNITSSTGPSPRFAASMAYDASDGYVLLFGGTPDGFRMLSDTWRFLSGSWTSITTSSGPSSRATAAMAFDAADGYVMLFGGAGAGSLTFSDTWKFLAGSWTNITSSSGPSERVFSSMVYDAADNYMVLFGGACNLTAIPCPLGDTWKFLAGSWTNITSSTGPSLRFSASLVYDYGDGFALLFGGTRNFPGFLGDTWKFSGGSWSNITSSTGPVGQAFASMAYDAPDGYVLFFGAGAVNTWKFSSGAWTSFAPMSPPSRYGASMAYDAADGYVLFFGGAQGADTTSALNDTWEFKAGVWTQLFPSVSPSSRALASMVYDVADNYILLFGGRNSSTSFRGDTWEFKAGVWTQLSPSGSPSPRGDASTAYDAADGYVLLFGGLGSAGFLGDTWEFKAGVWTQLSPSSSPSSRIEASIDYDAADHYVLLFGGLSGIGVLDDTWEFNAGAWTQLSTSVSPSARHVSSMAYDSADGFILLFGGLNSTSTVSTNTEVGDTWGFKAGTWTEVFPSTSPPPSFVNSMAYDGADGYVLLYIGGSLVGSSGDLWKFSSSSTPPAFDYSLSNNGHLSITQGSSGTVTITATLTAGTAQTVTLSCSGLPSGITCGVFTMNPLTPTGSSSLTVDVASSVMAGPYSFMVTGSPLGATTTPTTVSVTVTTLDNTSTAISCPSSVPFDFIETCTVTVADATNPSKIPTGSVSLTTSDTTIGQVDPSCTLDSSGGCTVAIVGSAPGSFTVTGSYGGDTAHNPSSGTSGTITVSAPALDITSTTVSCSSSLTVGLTGSCNISVVDTINAANIPTGTVSFTSSATTIGAVDVSCTLDSSGGCSVTITGVGAGSFTVTGAYGGDSSHSPSPGTSGSISVTGVFDYSLSNSGPVGITQDSSGPVTITATLKTGTAVPVTLSCVTPLPTGVTCNFVTNPLTPTLTGGTSVLTISTTSATSIGPFALMISGSPLGATTTPTSVSVTVIPAPFDYSLSNNGPVSVVQGSSGTVTITATLNVGSAQAVTLSCATPLPTGVSCGFASATVTPTTPGATDVLTISTTASAPPGPFTLVVNGSPAGATASGATTSVSVTVTPPPFDFSLSTPSPSSLTVTQGSTSETSSITATLVSGTPEPVGFFVSTSSLPGGITPIFTNNPCTPTCAVTVSFSATSSAPVGTFTLTILALNGAHRIELSLTVLPPPALFGYSLSVGPGSASVAAGSSTSATVTATLTGGTAPAIALEVSISPSPSVCQSSTSSPCGSISFSPETITPSGQGASSTLTISTTILAPPGTYTLTITGSPAGSLPNSATFTLTITAPSVSSVGCGHGLSCSVLSNATLSNIKFAGNTIHVEADGPHGAGGYANVTVPKSSIPHVDELHVFVDNNKLSNSAVTMTSNSTDYFVYFTFTFHSPVLIDIQLTAPEPAPNAPTILGLDPTLFYETVGALVAVIALVSAALVVHRRGRTRPTI